MSANGTQETAKAAGPRYLFGDCEFSCEERTLTRGGFPVPLRAKVHALLSYLLEQRHRSVSRDELCKQVWSGRCISDSTMASTVKALRRALGDNGELQRVIRTISGHGYRFIAAVAIVSPTGNEIDNADLVRAPGLTPTSVLPAPSSTVHELVVLTLVPAMPGSTESADAVSTADWRKLWQKAEALTQRYEGTCTNFGSRGVRVCFGYPYAQEDAAARAIETALSLVGDMRVPVPTPPRVCAGALITFGRHNEGQTTLEVSSETLLENAEAGAVLLTDSVRRRLRGDFIVEAITRAESNVYSWHRVVPDRVVAASARKRAPLMHRDDEVAIIQARWQTALEGRGQLLVISGEAGIGKTRLVDVAVERMRSDDPLVLRTRSVALHSHSPYYPFTELIRDEFGDGAWNDGSLTARRLASALRSTGLDPVNTIAALVPILAHEGSDDDGATAATGRNRRVIETLLRWLLALCETRAVVLVWEDLHWADASSLTLLDAAIEQIPTSRLLLVATCRTEGLPELPPRGFVGQITLERLRDDQSEELVQHLPEGSNLSPSLLEQVVTRCDGVPLFIEEYVTMLGEVELREGAIKSSGPSEGGDVPITLTDVLIARFDRLDPGAAVVRIAAVLGRTFDEAALARLGRLDEITLRRGLKQLVDTEILHVRGFAPCANYRFKHALVQEAAYEMLSPIERARYHRRAAHMLVRDQTMLDNRLAGAAHEAIAFHFERAGDTSNAVEHWLRAGQIATSLAGFVEARQQLEHAYQLLREEPASELRDRVELAIIVALGAAHAGSGGYSGEGAGEAYGRALELCHVLDDPPESVNVFSGAGSFEFMRANYRAANAIARRAIALGKARDNPISVLVGRRVRGAVALVQGRCHRAIALLENVVMLYEHHPNARRSYALDHKTTALCYIALARLAVGEADTALTIARTSLEHARHCDRHSHNYALCYLAAVHHVRGDPPQDILSVAERSLALAREEGFVTWIGMSELLCGAALVGLGSHEDGREAVERGVRAHTGMRAQTFEPFTRSVLAETLFAIGQHEQALSMLDVSEALSDSTGQWWYLPEQWRLHARLLDQQARFYEAQNYLCLALNLSIKHGTDGWTYRVLRDLTRTISLNGATMTLSSIRRPPITRIREGRSVMVASTLATAWSEFEDSLTAAPSITKRSFL